MSILKWALLVAAMLMAAATVHAAGELPRPRQLSVADGLPSSHVNGMAEDQAGFLWLATADGLARYDGTGFRIWRVEDGLADSFLWAVDIDSRGRVWMGTALAGLVRYDPDTGSFHDAAGVGVPEVDREQVWAVVVDAEDSVWFGTGTAGLYRRHADGRVERFLPIDDDPRSLPSASVSVIGIAPDGSVWVGTRDGVARWTGRDFERLPEGALPDGRVNSLAFEADGSV
ncbi:MAG: histidine kinase, partial [Gammaproteobacteria bacterium]|nr:histidine kinase [Gammaproteobacteria bacterium]